VHIDKELLSNPKALEELSVKTSLSKSLLLLDYDIINHITHLVYITIM